MYLYLIVDRNHTNMNRKNYTYFIVLKDSMNGTKSLTLRYDSTQIMKVMKPQSYEARYLF